MATSHAQDGALADKEAQYLRRTIAELRPFATKNLGSIRIDVCEVKRIVDFYDARVDAPLIAAAPLPAETDGPSEEEIARLPLILNGKLGHAYAAPLADSVVPAWIQTVSFQQQSVLLLALRGPDGVRKHHPAKAITIAYRGTILRAAERQRFLYWGEPADTFMALDVIADESAWRAAVKEFFAHVDELPHHYVSHLAHAAQIIACHHPQEGMRQRWHQFYAAWCDDLHVSPETQEEMDKRLDDWGTAPKRLRALLSKPASAGSAPDDPEMDATDFAHPAWWRGNDAGVEAVVRIANEVLDGKDNLAGVSGSDTLQALRERLHALAAGSAPGRVTVEIRDDGTSSSNREPVAYEQVAGHLSDGRPASPSSLGVDRAGVLHPALTFYDWLRREYENANPLTGEAFEAEARPLISALADFIESEQIDRSLSGGSVRPAAQGEATGPVDQGRVEALEEAPAEEVLRGLASYLGVGGYNADKVDADVFDRKIRDGIDMLVKPWVDDANRYRKLRRVGAAPAGTIALDNGTVFVSTNLDRWADEYLANGLPPAPSDAVEATFNPQKPARAQSPVQPVQEAAQSEPAGVGLRTTEEEREKMRLVHSYHRCFIQSAIDDIDTLSAALRAEQEARQAAERRAMHLELQAKGHACEADTANSTIAEIYQLCTGSTGEPGNWNGAEPVRKALDGLRARAEAAERRAEEAERRADGLVEALKSVQGLLKRHGGAVLGHVFKIIGTALLPASPAQTDGSDGEVTS